MKKIHIIFPEYTAAEYRKIISEVNRDIYNDNVSHPFKRILVHLITCLFFILSTFLFMIVFYNIYGKYIVDITGRKLLFHLFITLLLFFCFFLFIMLITTSFKKNLYQAMRLRKRTESYTILKFSERRQIEKQKYNEFLFYEACDRLKPLNVVDISFTPTGNNLCRVTITSSQKNGLNSFQETFEGIHLVQKKQNATSLDLWLNLEKKELIVYIPYHQTKLQN